jgi:DNA-binding NarL/FixJ family response regulator
MISDSVLIFLVDDHPFILEGLRTLLAKSPGFRVCGESSDPLLALSLIPDSGAQILITDLSMPGLSGVELTRKIREKMPDLKVLALSMHGDEGHVREMLDAGISGYILKNTGKAELLEALNRIASGGMYFSQEVAAELLKPRPAQAPVREQEEQIRLTPREKEIVCLIAQELSNAEIAERLFISERTVETHRKNIFHKTKTKSVAGLIRFAMHQGIVQ